MPDGTRRPGADGALPSVPPWLNLEAVLDAETLAELAQLPAEVDAFTRSFADLGERCRRALLAVDGASLVDEAEASADASNGTFELLHRYSGAERLMDALLNLVGHVQIAVLEEPGRPVRPAMHGLPSSSSTS